MNLQTDRQESINEAEKVLVSVFHIPSGPVLWAATLQKITF